jgi:hypothetical protein
MTTPNNICNSTAYQNSVLLKQRFQLKNIPPERYDNLANNPYLLSYTQPQLDMRRKAEILKYSATHTNTKTNNLTKAQRWAQLVNGSTQQRELSSSFIQSNTISQTSNSISVQTCPSGTIITTPSYASGIPGPITTLFLDPTVPLYNFATGQDPYALINQQSSTIPFIYDNGLDKLDQPLTFINYVPQNTVTLTSIYIQNITTPRYSFTIQFPLSIYIRADVLNTIISNTTAINTNIGLHLFNPEEPFVLTLQYGNNPIQNITYDLVLDISSSVLFDVSMIPNSSDPLNNYFYGNQYIGMCTLQNFRITDSSGNTIQEGISTQMSYIYDILLNSVDSAGIPLLDITIPNPDQFFKYFNQPQYGFYMNVSLNSLTTVNCSTIGSYPNISNYSILSVT